MSTFISAMDKSSSDTSAKTKTGVNGAPVYTSAGVGDSRVALMTRLVRSLDKATIQSLMDAVLAEDASLERIRDLVILSFQTRDVRGGKGERDLAFAMWEYVLQRFPDLGLDCLSLVPEYGSWQDFRVLFDRCEGAFAPALAGRVRSRIAELWRVALDKDVTRLNEVLKATPDAKTVPGLSLAAKWAPREHGKFRTQAVQLAKMLLADRATTRLGRTLSDDELLMHYRKTVSKLNRYLDTTEIKMAEGDFRLIDPTHVPGRCMHKHKKAFLNEKLKGKGELRHPDSEDRMACRETFQATLAKVAKGEAKLHGSGSVYPHELIRNIRNADSEDERAVMTAQWADIVEKTREQGGMRKTVPMCDFSGSMWGLPYDVSMAMGLLVSETNHPTFRNRVLTFDAAPSWCVLPEGMSLVERARKLAGTGQGLNTNFEAACGLIVDMLVSNRVPVGEEPEDLLVITDMGFDDARSATAYSHYGRAGGAPWQTLLQTITRRFLTASAQVWGGSNAGWKVPRIVIWNVAASFDDHHAKADTPGVATISGWSPAILKALLAGEDGSLVNTGYETFRRLVDDERYDAVRALLDKHVPMSTGPAPSADKSEDSLADHKTDVKSDSARDAAYKRDDRVSMSLFTQK
jgi:hypothetical protein